MTRNIFFQNKSYLMIIAGNQGSKCDIIYKNWITLKRVMIFFTPWQELTIPILEPGLIQTPSVERKYQLDWTLQIRSSQI